MNPPRYPFIHSLDASAPPAPDLQIIRAADCPAEPVEWLWPEKIPIGKVTLLIGDPGTGKSLVALDVAARLSRGGAWPNHQAATADRAESKNNLRQGDKEKWRQGEEIIDSQVSLSPCLPVSPSSPPHAATSNPSNAQPPTPGSTLVLSAEDNLADTIRPRLDALGADPRNVFVVPSIHDLRHDFAQLRVAVGSVPNCRLIIVDPINAYVGPADSHFQTVVQKVLAPLAELASEKRIAVLAIAHLRKTDGAAIHRAAGSVGFVAAARSVWTICRDPENPNRQLLLPLKNNLSPAACGLAYSIEQHPTHSAPRIAWESAPLQQSAETALAPKNRGPESVELNDAAQWLKKNLEAGPWSAASLIRRADQFGFHKRTIQRALGRINGHTQNRGPLNGWWWSLTPLDDHEKDWDETLDTLLAEVVTPPTPQHLATGLAPSELTTPDLPDPSSASSTQHPPSGPDSTPPQINIPTPPKKPVTSPKTCHLSENTSFRPAKNLSPLPQPQRRTARFSDQSPAPPAQNARTPPPSDPPPARKRTGHPLLDHLLDALRAAHPASPP